MWYNSTTKLLILQLLSSQINVLTLILFFFWYILFNFDCLEILHCKHETYLGGWLRSQVHTWGLWQARLIFHLFVLWGNVCLLIWIKIRQKREHNRAWANLESSPIQDEVKHCIVDNYNKKIKYIYEKGKF